MRTDPVDVARREYKSVCRAAALCQETAKSAMHEGLRRRLASGSMRDREWWSTAKRAAGEARNSETPVPTDASGATHTSNREKAEAFGQHFSSKCSLSDQDFLNGVFPEVRRRTNQHIRTVHFRVAAVKAALRKLVPSKATGQDRIPARVLKECASELALPLSKLFTLSFVTGACPAAWKIAIGPGSQEEGKIRSQELPPTVLPAGYVKGYGKPDQSELDSLPRTAKGPLSTPIPLPTRAGNIGSPHQAEFRMEPVLVALSTCLLST